MAVDGHSTPAIERVQTQGQCKNLAWKACYLGPSTAVTRTLQTSREVQAWCTRHLVASVVHSFLMPPAIGPPTLQIDMRALSNSSLAAVYLWLVIAKAVSRLDNWSCLMQPRCVVHTHTHDGIKQLQSFERRQECRNVTRDKWTVGIGFHSALYRHHTPGVCVLLHQCFPRSTVRRCA